MGRRILYQLMIDWDFDGTYTDESAYLESADGVMRLAAPASSISNPGGIVDSCALSLDNRAGRFSPMNAAGPLYGLIYGGRAYHAPMYLRVSIDGGVNYHRIFTGVIKVPKETGPRMGDGASAKVDCRSVDETLLTKRVSTTGVLFSTAYNDFYTEHDHMLQWLSDAGLSTPGNFVLDDGLFVIPWGWLDDESPLEEIWSLAAACGGRFYADPDGVLRYENAQHWLKSPHATSQETFTAADYERIEPYYDDRELYSAVTVEMAQRGLAPRGPVWEADGVVTVRANSSKTIMAKLRQPAYSIDSVEFTAVTGGGTNIDSYVSATLTKYAQRVEIAVANSHPNMDANLVNLALTGVAVDGGPSQEKTVTSTASFWTNRQGRTKTLRANPYIQTVAQMNMLGEFLRDRYEEPRQFFILSGVPGNPARRLGDRVTINDANTMSAARDAFITEIDWSLNRSGFTQNIAAMDAAELYPTTDYFVIGTDVVGSGTKVTFY